MGLLKDAFDILNDFLQDEIGIVDSIGAISTMLDGAEYYRVRRQSNIFECFLCSANAITSGRGNKVTFFDGTFYNFLTDSKRIPELAIVTIIHETAHVWDSSNNNMFSSKMRESLGCYVSWCNPENSLGKNKKEDWAYSFARYVTGDQIATVSQGRKDYIQEALTVTFIP